MILPSVLRKWYDSDFGNDIWAKDGAYYAAARTKLSALSAFKQHCAEYGDILQVLKLLVQFFEDERRKAVRGTTTKKKVVVGGTDGAGGGGAPGGRPLPAVEVLEEGEIKEMHISKHAAPFLDHPCGASLRCKRIPHGFGAVWYNSPCSQVRVTAPPDVDL